MRDIKFRAKAQYFDEDWIYGLIFKSGKELEWTELQTEDGHDFYVDSETVGQYTGLKDKNGREIYEGDIVQIHNDKKSVFEIRWVGGGFYRRHKFMQKYKGESWEEITDLPMYPSAHIVIGNIHENPELLEGESGD